MQGSSPHPIIHLGRCCSTFTDGSTYMDQLLALFLRASYLHLPPDFDNSRRHASVMVSYTKINGCNGGLNTRTQQPRSSPGIRIPRAVSIKGGPIRAHVKRECGVLLSELHALLLKAIPSKKMLRDCPSQLRSRCALRGFSASVFVSALGIDRMRLVYAFLCPEQFCQELSPEYV